MDRASQAIAAASERARVDAPVNAAAETVRTAMADLEDLAPASASYPHYGGDGAIADLRGQLGELQDAWKRCQGNPDCDFLDWYEAGASYGVYFCDGDFHAKGGFYDASFQAYLGDYRAAASQVRSAAEGLAEAIRANPGSTSVGDSLTKPFEWRMMPTPTRDEPRRPGRPKSSKPRS